MYERSLRQLNDFLAQSVATSPETLVEIPPDATKLHGKYWDISGHIYKEGSNGAVSVDNGGVVDGVTGLVEGDHYATSHYTLMSAALFRLTGDKQYLNRVKTSLPFCVSQLSGYPRVPWGMHYDFNNYAVALALKLVEENLDSVTVSKIHQAELRAPINRHRVGNWWGQRLVYAALLGEQGGLLGLKGRLIRSLYSNKFRECVAPDGCIEDKKGGSRPIQYHAFSLALGFLLWNLSEESGSTSILTEKELVDGARYLCQFIDPDGDFNYHGRGHKQIFAYAPALFVLTMFPHVPECESLIEKVWNHVATYQHEDGSFPLVLSLHDDVDKVGWYDYHRHSVYNAFFGAWLALTACAQNGIAFSPVKDLSSPANCAPRDSEVAFLRNNDCSLSVSTGHGKYRSECTLALQRLYIAGFGIVTSCPGGPEDRAGGFGSINKFPHIESNFFSPLIMEGQRWVGPDTCEDFRRSADSLEISAKYGNCVVERRVSLESNQVAIVDQIALEKGNARIRIVNMPLNIEDCSVNVTSDGLILSRSGMAVKIVLHTGVQAGLQRVDNFSWVDGHIEVYAIESEVHANEPFVVQTVIEWGPE